MSMGESLGLESQGIANDVRRGLSSRPKTLPPYLFYDETGSQLYERITELPEYYLTRAERRILSSHAHDIVDLVGAGREHLTVIELGAGSATKTETLLRAIVVAPTSRSTSRQPFLRAGRVGLPCRSRTSTFAPWQRPTSGRFAP